MLPLYHHPGGIPPHSEGVPGLIDGYLRAAWDDGGNLCLSVVVGTNGEAARIDCVLPAEHASTIWKLITERGVPMASFPCGVGVRLNNASCLDDKIGSHQKK